MGRVRRVHVAPTGTAAVDRVGEGVELSREECHHVVRVLRLTVGERVEAFDGRGGRWVAEIAGIGGETVRLGLLERLDGPVEPPLAVVLYQAGARAEKIDWVVQKATEIGVVAVRLYAAARSATPPPSPNRLRRWRRIALEAVKQCGRDRTPEVEWVAETPPVPGPSVRALLLDAGERAGPLGALGPSAGEREVWLAVGPEGGLAPRETDAWLDAGWRAAGLGPRTLRTETAGLVAASILLHRWGDLGRDPGPVAPV